MAGFLKDLLLQETRYAQDVEQDFAQCMHVHFRVRGVKGRSGGEGDGPDAAQHANTHALRAAPHTPQDMPAVMPPLAGRSVVPPASLFVAPPPAPPKRVAQPQPQQQNRQ